MARTAEIVFTEDQVIRLTGLSRRQLRYWEKTGFFSPAYPAGSGSFFSFRDVVGLRTIAQLRREVPLQELRRVGEWLHEYGDAPWSKLRFYVLGKRVYFRGPGDRHPVTHRPKGQAATEYAMVEIARATREKVDAIRARPSDAHGKIEKRGSRAFIRGTRVSTESVWTLHREGASHAAIREAYPHLTEDDVRGAIAYELKRIADIAAA